MYNGARTVESIENIIIKRKRKTRVMVFKNTPSRKKSSFKRVIFY